MLCEKCAHEVETVRCESCGKEVVRLGPFCYGCGTRLENKVEQAEQSDLDFENRVLCSDGACIGVVEMGVCKVCGKPYVPES